MKRHGLYNENRKHPSCNCKILGNKKMAEKSSFSEYSVNYMQK